MLTPIKYLSPNYNYLLYNKRDSRIVRLYPLEGIITRKNKLQTTYLAIQLIELDTGEGLVFEWKSVFISKTAMIL